MVKRGRGGLFAGTFGVWLLTLPARARDPWTLPMVASICLLVTQDCGVLRCFCGSCRRGDFRWLAECGRMRGRGGKVMKGERSYDEVDEASEMDKGVGGCLDGESLV